MNRVASAASLVLVVMCLPACFFAGGDSEELFLAGKQLYEMQDYSGAVEQWSGITDSFADTFEYNLWMGKAQRRAGAYPQAVERLTRASHEALPSGELYRERSLAYASMGDLERALSDAHRAVNMEPNDAETLFHRAGLLYALERHEQAADDWKSLVKQNPQAPEARYNLGLALLKLERWKEAEQALAACRREGMDSAEVLNSLGVAYENCGRREEAYQLYSEALAKAPTYVAAQYNRADLALRMGLYQEARADLDDLLGKTKNEELRKRVLRLLQLLHQKEK